MPVKLLRLFISHAMMRKISLGSENLTLNRPQGRAGFVSDAGNHLYCMRGQQCIRMQKKEHVMPTAFCTVMHLITTRSLR